MVVIRNQFHPGPVLHRAQLAEPLVGQSRGLADLTPLQLAARVRRAVKRSGMHINDFMHGTGLHHTTLRAMETGSIPRPANRLRIEAALTRLEHASNAGAR